MCQKKGIDFTGYTSIRDDASKEDILDAIVKTLQDEADAVGGGEDKSEPQVDVDCLTMDTDPDPKQKKPRKPKFKAPRIIFIFDDLSGELQAPSLTKLLKKHRHFLCKVIISSQYWNDIPPQGRTQINYVLLFKGLSQTPAKLKEIYDNCDLPVQFDVFLDIYRFCTNELFNFMYIDAIQGKFRKNFTFQIDLPKELGD